MYRTTVDVAVPPRFIITPSTITHKVPLLNIRLILNKSEGRSVGKECVGAGVLGGGGPAR